MHSAFMAAIAASPDSLLPHLIFADWLDDYGHDACAEFVRIECRLAGGSLGGYEREALRRRADRLFPAAVEYWEGVVSGATGYHPSDSDFEYECGVLRSVSASLLRMDASRLFDLVPIRRLKLGLSGSHSDCAPALVEAAVGRLIPLMGMVEGVAVTGRWLTADGVLTLASVPRLTAWYDDGVAGADSLELLSASPFRQRARSVRATISSSRSLSAVERLCAGGALHSLGLRSYSLDVPVPGSDCAAAVADSGRAWRHLGLVEIGLADADVDALVGRGDLRNLDTLLLYGNPITEAGDRRLVSCQQLASLQTLWCDHPRRVVRSLHHARGVACQAGLQPPMPSLVQVGHPGCSEDLIRLTPLRASPVPHHPPVRHAPPVECRPWSRGWTR